MRVSQSSDSGRSLPKMKYTNQQLEDALNSIDASDKTKRILEKDLRWKNESTWWGYLILLIGILTFLLNFLTFINPEQQTPEDRTTRQMLFWFGLFMITAGRFRIHRVRIRKSVIELMMKYSESDRDRTPIAEEPSRTTARTDRVSGGSAMKNG